MANYFYVKAGGTAVGATVDSADGVYSTQQTGAWSGTASEYYPNLNAVDNGTVVPVSGDFILVSDLHNASFAAGGFMTFSGGTTGVGLTIASVDDTDRTLYKPGAVEAHTDAFGTFLTGHILVAGVSLKGEATSMIELSTGANVRFQDLTLTAGTGSTDKWFQMTGDGMHATMVNVDMEMRHAANTIWIGAGGKIEWHGGAVTGGLVATKLIDLYGTGGTTVEFKGVDLAQVGTLTTTVVEADDGVSISLESCTMRSAVTLPTMLDSAQIFKMSNCDDTTDDDYHRFHWSSGSGTVTNNDATYVTATNAWYGGTAKSSMEVVTTATAGHCQPFTFMMPSQYVDLSLSASDTITVHLTTTLTLTDTEIAAFLVYPDGTTAVQPNWVTSGKTVGAGNYGTDPLAAGTELSASALGAASWTGEPTTKFYKLDIDTTGDAGQASALAVRIEVYRASIASGTLFIHPLMTYS